MQDAAPQDTLPIVGAQVTLEPMEESPSQPQQDLPAKDSQDQRFRNKFLQLRERRKIAEEDTQLLQNRIKMLEKEEQKNLKKIDKIRDKAKKIMENKRRNQRTQAEKQKVNPHKLLNICRLMH